MALSSANGGGGAVAASMVCVLCCVVRKEKDKRISPAAAVAQTFGQIAAADILTWQPEIMTAFDFPILWSMDLIEMTNRYTLAITIATINIHISILLALLIKV